MKTEDQMMARRSRPPAWASQPVPGEERWLLECFLHDFFFVYDRKFISLFYRCDNKSWSYRDRGCGK